MKYLIYLLFTCLIVPSCLLIFSCSKSEEDELIPLKAELIGTWNIHEYTFFIEDSLIVISTDSLDKLGIVWTLTFKDEGKYQQTRNNFETGIIETQDGTWIINEYYIIIDIGSDDDVERISYEYKLKGDFLEFRLDSSGAYLYRIIAIFKRE